MRQRLSDEKLRECPYQQTFSAGDEHAIVYPIAASGCTFLQHYAVLPRDKMSVPRCAFSRMRIDPRLVQFAAHGNEALETVMGQPEEAEYVRYTPGAFVWYNITDHTDVTNAKTVPLKHTPPSPLDDDSLYYIRDVLGNMTVASISSDTTWQSLCETSQTAPISLLIQRYEYVNLFHTMTDLWNTWEVYRKLRDQTNRTIQIVLLDAHPHGLLDDVWRTLFGTVTHLHALLHPNAVPSGAAVCLDAAYWIPAGYASRLYRAATTRCPDVTMRHSFVQFVLERYRLESVHKIPGRITLIDRRGALVTHARAVRKQTASARDIDNLSQIQSWIQQQRVTTRHAVTGASVDVSVHIVALHTLSFRQQIQVVRESEVLIGNHGAGLTHLLFLDDGSHVIEFDALGVGLFEQLNHWNNERVGYERVQYHVLEALDSTMDETYFTNHLWPTLRNVYDV